MSQEVESNRTIGAAGDADQQSRHLAVQRQPIGFSIVPRTMDEAIHFCEIVTKTEACPKGYKGKPGEALVAIMAGGEVGLKPLQSLQNIAVINGMPSIWGDALPALIEGQPDFRDRIETIGETEATCIIKRVNIQTGDPREDVVRTYTLADAKQAGLLAKEIWLKHTKRMLQMRARAWAIRDSYPHVLKGLGIVEEVITMDAPPLPAERYMGAAEVVGEAKAPEQVAPADTSLAAKLAAKARETQIGTITDEIAKATTAKDIDRLLQTIKAIPDPSVRMLLGERWKERLKVLKTAEAAASKPAAKPEPEAKPKALPEGEKPPIDAEFVREMEAAERAAATGSPGSAPAGSSDPGPAQNPG